MPYRILCFTILAVGLSVLGGDNPSPPPGVKNTQNPKDIPPTPEEAVRSFKAPEGFKVTLFAGEPDVAQPIAMAWDDRGRLYVAECYSYPDWQATGKDRILVFEDTDGDGKFDKRWVFLDNLPNLTGIQVGHGGVWALCAPNLLFIPDKDGKGVPDGKPQVVLDGWTLKAKHNIVNGLTWGPDGWLYGCHGIVADSKPGVPGTPDDKRPVMNCGIWRFHPVTKQVEIVCHGTTNPWGLDFDEHGEGFFTNCVIGHLWHMIPGAHYKRMYGQDFNRYCYDLIDATSDHLHWGGGHWTTSRGGQGVHSEAGGGHAHSGCLVYQGDMFPAKYRNALFTCNIHGNRLNHDRLVREGCAYVGKHAPDFVTSDNLWFRGVALTTGPDGAVYVADWCDFGECHDNDGVHRSSGRIYRIAYGEPKKNARFDLRRKTDDELIKLVVHENEWFSGRARVLLAERAIAKGKAAEFSPKLQALLEKSKDTRQVLRAMWCLNATCGPYEVKQPEILHDPAPWLALLLTHKDEHVRAWAIRLLADAPHGIRDFHDILGTWAAAESAGLVHLYVASALRKVDGPRRFDIAKDLLRRAEDAADRYLPLLIWYGIEPAVAEHPKHALGFASTCRVSKLRHFIARRLAETEKVASLDIIVEAASETAFDPVRRDLLQGMRDGLKGRRNVTMPKNWREAYARLSTSDSAEIRSLAMHLALQFDDADAIKELRGQIVKQNAPPDDRALALVALVEKGIPGLESDLFRLLDESAMRGPALRALAAYQSEETPKEILKRFASFKDTEKQDALSTLASRPKYALALLDAVEAKKVQRGDVTPFLARQMLDLKNATVKERMEKVWGQIRQSPGEKKALIDKYKGMLTPAVLAKADLAHGRLIFSKTCAQCHRLFGEGASIGPDLTGSDRANLHYVLENSVDPSAVIGNDYRLTNIVTKKGRLIAGIIVEETERALTVQTATERFVLSKADVDERTQSNVSMMPEGQLEKLTPEELRDLVGYLASKQQVPLPK